MFCDKIFKMNEFYFSEKKIKKSFFRKIKIGAVILALIILAGTLFYLTVYSSLFKIKNIEIIQSDNAEKVDVDRLFEDYKEFLINQSKISAFLGADNILSWKDSLAGEFLKNYNKLNKFEIQKDFINKQIKITVEGRQKFGVWCKIQQEESALKDCYWFDKKGVIFDNAPYVEGELMYKISDFSKRNSKIGDAIISQEMFLNLLKIFEIMNQSGITVKSFAIKNLEFQEIETNSDLAPKIYFSLKLNPSFTLPAFQNLKKIGMDKVDYIDFRVENRAYYKPK